MANITVFDPDGKLLLEVGPDDLAIGPLANEYMSFIETYTYRPKGSVEREGKLIDVFTPISMAERTRIFLANLEAAGCQVEGNA